MNSKKIAVLIGSLRKESFSLKTAKALISLAPTSLTFEILEIGQLPLYNEDLEQTPPDTWTRFREGLKSFDGILFVTPDRKSTRLNSSHLGISYAVFCLK